MSFLRVFDMYNIALPIQSQKFCLTQEPKFQALAFWSQAKFVTCYCLSTILFLREKKLSLEITFLMCVVEIKTF